MMFILLMLQVACSTKQPFVWVERFPSPQREAKAYLIQAGDIIEVSVWDQAQISGQYVVRSDGSITVPLIGDVVVAGISPTAAAETIRTRLEGDIVQDVRVVVIAREMSTRYVSVVGEVNQAGQFVLKPEDNILDLLARAGGLTEFADKENVYVLRKGAPIPRIRFDYTRLTTTKTGGISFKLQPGDVIVVE